MKCERRDSAKETRTGMQILKKWMKSRFLSCFYPIFFCRRIVWHASFDRLRRVPPLPLILRDGCAENAPPTPPRWRGVESVLAFPLGCTPLPDRTGRIFPDWCLSQGGLPSAFAGAAGCTSLACPPPPSRSGGIAPAPAFPSAGPPAPRGGCVTRRRRTCRAGRRGG